MKKIILFSLFALSYFVNYSQTIRKEYSENNFKLKHPNTWTINTNNGALFFTSPKLDANDKFQENINLMLQDLSKKPMTLEQYTELTKKQVIDNLGASIIVSLNNILIAGQQGKEFVYNMTYKGKSLKIKQYWFIINNTAYLFSFTAESSQYNKYESIATEMIKSFKFYQ